MPRSTTFGDATNPWFPAIDFAELTALVNAGDLSEVTQYTADHAPHTFVNFWTFDPTPMMQLFDIARARSPT